MGTAQGLSVSSASKAFPVGEFEFRGIASTCGLKNKKNREEDKVESRFFKTPGTIIMLPFVVIVGLDLVLNIFFVVKRTYEYFVLGQIPSTETWW